MTDPLVKTLLCVFGLTAPFIFYELASFEYAILGSLGVLVASQVDRALE
ncbi:hypothetical protein [Halopiger xanaduensis]|uniref:Uncharacterized protein n=1 Tax=Halopiger xanaduensis (strain DSM 18323 / JCM 14033 / SH-6) TaxID=797210 RepID=F8DER4_HALXS|nr:hypothetical protein [Halopiger xanaduensis]AEH39504.1 hypothetical protein Halxa_0264 [Halopiger xanaduensis SH-6]